MERMYRKGLFKHLLLMLLTMTFLTGCVLPNEKAYYADSNHYIRSDAVVENIIYDEGDKEIVFWLQELDEAYVTSSFIIRGRSAELLLENDVFDKIKIGDTITFTSAPRIFGNGHFFPIVQLAVSGDELLSFEEGHQNLLAEYPAFGILY